MVRSVHIEHYLFSRRTCQASCHRTLRRRRCDAHRRPVQPSRMFGAGGALMTHRCTTEKPNDHVLLLDGTEIAVRRLTRHDIDAIVDLHRQLTDRERYFRFFTVLPARLEEFAHKLVQRTPTWCALGASTTAS